MNHVYKLDDSSLVQACRSGDAAAQQALYQRFYRNMYGVCLRYTSAVADAEDVMQEGFIKVFTRLDQYAGNGSLEGWIRQIMVRSAISLYRKQSRMLFVDSHAPTASESLPAEQLARLSEQELVAMIQRLPDGYRTVFNLYAIEGFNHREIAALLHISEGTSKSQYARARAQLRRMLEGDDSTTNAKRNYR